jgi:hypothetical protein
MFICSRIIPQSTGWKFASSTPLSLPGLARGLKTVTPQGPGRQSRTSQDGQVSGGFETTTPCSRAD